MATVNEKMTAIADAIRNVTGYIGPLTLDDMAIGVNDVYSKGGEEGYQAGLEEGEEYGFQSGYDVGYEEGVSDGAEAGKLEERNALWEVLTDNGAKGVYYYTFSEKRWTKDNFKPTHNIVPTEADHTFYRHNYGGTAYDMAQRFEDGGAVLDLSNCTLGNYTFDNAVISRLPELNVTKCTFTCFVRNCRFLVTIDKLICNNAGDQNFTQTFNSCNLLKNITFEGAIGRSISFPASPLSVESLKSVITHLKNYAGTGNEYAYTVTFKSSAFSPLEDEGATSPNGNTWAEYIDDIKWNLTLA